MEQPAKPVEKCGMDILKRVARIWAIGVLVLIGLVPLVFLGRYWLGTRRIEISGGDKCWNVPDKATNIYARGSFLAFAAEFDIAEEDFREYCTERGWTLTEIVDEVGVTRYLAYDDKDDPDERAYIRSGLIYNGMTHRGGFVVAYDRVLQKGYLEYAHH